MIVRMGEFGRSLVARGAGRSAYEIIAPTLRAAKETVVFDFSGVETITNSYADEVFGRMVLEMGMDELRRRTTFVCVSPFLAQVVRAAMDTREAERQRLACC